MSELSDESKELLRLGRDALRPTADDRARIASSLAARLGPGAFTPGTPAVVPGPRPVPWRSLAGSAAGVGVAAVGVFIALREPPPPAQSPQSAAALVTSVAAPPEPEPIGAVSATAAASTAPAPEPIVPEERRKPAAAPRDSLSEEVAILSRATAALRASRAAEALRLLDEHQRRFPSGRLVEERLGARIHALCALGRRTEAEAALARLASLSPRSPHLARARAACGLESPAPATPRSAPSSAR